MICNCKKEIIFIGCISLICLTILAQEIQHEAVAVNVEVPVRVFKGDTFIDNLTIDDFEVYEDGVLQNIEAVYLIKKTDIQREDTELEKEAARQKFSPDTKRNFVLLFEMLDYLPKLEEAIDYFFENVFSPGDTLTVVTPIKNYNFKKDSFEKLSREVIVKQLKKKVKKDITIGAREFKSMVRDLDFISESARHGDRTAGIKAIEVQRQLRNFRYISEENIMNFKDYLDNQEGQKHIFFFYQKNNIPVPANLPTLDYFEEGKDIFFDVKKIKHTFSDSSISIHFIFLTKIRQANLDVSRFDSSGIQSVDNSQEIFSTFFEMAKTTGGTTESTANAASGFQRAAHAAENYYLLYYSPKNYKADEKFRRIEVKVKGKGYRVTHRAGYFAN